eukprot:5093937-Prymnesium_polylepis.1
MWYDHTGDADGTHTVGGVGKMAGKQVPCAWYAWAPAERPAASAHKRGAADPITRSPTRTRAS